MTERGKAGRPITPLTQFIDGLEGRAAPEGAQWPEGRWPAVKQLLIRLHELRLGGNARLADIQARVAAIEPDQEAPDGRRIGDVLTGTPRGNPRVPAEAIRRAIVEIYCDRDPTARREALHEEITKLTEKTEKPVSRPAVQRPAWLAPVLVVVFLIALMGVAAFGFLAHVFAGAVIEHPSFEQCLSQNSLTATPIVKAPPRTFAQKLGVATSQPPDPITQYTIAAATNAVQATVWFTPNLETARQVLDANTNYYLKHGINGHDLTVNNSTVVRPQTDEDRLRVITGCANGA